MSSALIYQWLQNDGNYDAGVALFAQFGNNGVLLQLLKTAKNSYTIKRLYEAMQQLAEKMDKEQQEISYNASFDITLSQKPDISYPTSIEDKIKRRKETYRRAGQLKSQVLYIVDPEKRKAAVFEIMALMKENAELWKQTEYYEKHGHEMPVKKNTVYPEFETISPKELSRFIANMRSNISKWKTKAKNNPAKAAQYQQKITEGEIQLNKAIAQNELI